MGTDSDYDEVSVVEVKRCAARPMRDGDVVTIDDNSTNEEDDEDYMTMTFADNDGAIDGTELDNDERISYIYNDKNEQKLQKGLQRNLIDSEPESKGLKMMKMMGFTPGQSLGKQQDHDTEQPLNLEKKLEPISIEIRTDRKGIGASNPKRRRREEIDAKLKKREQSQLEFRARIANEKERDRSEKTTRKLQTVAFDFYLKDHGNDKNIYENEGKSVPVCFRELVVHRQRAAKLKRLKMEQQQDVTNYAENDLTEYIIDEELDEFNDLEPEIKEEILQDYLRQNYNYCFWCGITFEDLQDMSSNCSGPSERDH